MALTDENGGMNTTMLVSPAGNVGGYPVYTQGNNGFGGFGGDGWWIVLLILLFAAGGWNNNNGNGFGGGMPYMINNDGNSVQRGFDQAAIMGGITGVQTGVQNLATQLCNCCGDMQMALANGFAGVEQSANARQMADMQQMFGVQSALQNCCCENRANIADLKYTVATENCADRAALSDGIRDILANQTASVQRILDQLCQDKIDAKNDTIAQLRQELLYARGQASQDVQTARILAGQTAEVDALYNRLDTCPVGTTPVYGRTPIFSCNNNSGCGCGCGNF